MTSTSPPTRRLLVAGALILFASRLSASQDEPLRLPADRLEGPSLAEVPVLGTYHMDNPGRDIFNEIFPRELASAHGSKQWRHPHSVFSASTRLILTARKAGTRQAARDTMARKTDTKT